MTDKTKAPVKPEDAETEEKVDPRPISGGDMHDPQKNRKRLNGGAFILTSAQNNTAVHIKFLASLKVMAERKDARILCGQYVYNKNGFQNGTPDSDDLWYAPVLKDLLHTDQVQIAKGLVWCGELNVLPTAINPLSGFEQYTGRNSSIVPHAKIGMESIATAKNQPAKFLYATGTVTLRNYIQKKAGQKAEAAHCYGALFVEKDDAGNWFARQIETDESGEFFDLDTMYHPGGYVQGQNVEAICWGDLHAEKSDAKVLAACFGDGGMLDQMMPQYQTFNDSLDMTARNHHNRKSGHFLAKMYFAGQDTVSQDLQTCADVLQMAYRHWCTGYVVESNHDGALLSWLDANDYDFRTDPPNALLWLRLQMEYYRSLANGEDLNIFEFALSDKLGDAEVQFMKTDESLKILDIECGVHGHIGANGSRGTPKQFQKLNMPMNTGHTHSASIYGKVYTAGVTGALDMGYNQGPSSWSHSHIVTYPNGKRAIITMKKKGRDWEYKA